MANQLPVLKYEIIKLYQQYQDGLVERDHYAQFLELYTLACIIYRANAEHTKHSEAIAKAYKQLCENSENITTNYQQLVAAIEQLGSQYIDIFSNTSQQTNSSNIQHNINTLAKLLSSPSVEPSNCTAEFSGLIQYIAENLSRGKAGEFTTPSAIVTLMVNLMTPKDGMAIYDPTCGTGGFLLAASQAAKNIELTGMDIAQTAIATTQQNLIINKLSKAKIEQGNSLTQAPATIKGKFDLVMANPPFALKNWNDGIDLAQDERFSYGYPPKSSGDYAFILHSLYALKSNGRAAIVVSTGALVRGGVEAKIRKQLIENNLIEGVIALPSSIFHGTALAANILILNKNKPKKIINFINAATFYTANRILNKLENEHIETIINLYHTDDEVKEQKIVIANEAVIQNDGILQPSHYLLKDFESEIKESVEQLSETQAILTAQLQTLQQQMEALKS